MQESSNNKIRNNSFTAAEQAGIEVFNSNGNNITGNYVKSQWYGVNIGGSDSNVIEGNNITGVRCGILQGTSSYSIIENNTFMDSLTGIQVNDLSFYNLIEKNIISHSNYCGIELHFNASHNRVIGNNITDNKHGLEIKSSTNNTLSYNNITGSSKIGVIFVDASKNLIQKNNFVENARHILSSESSNLWDADGKGNYWDDYNGTDNDNDGIGDAQYVIDESNIDRYPLINLINLVDNPNTVTPIAIPEIEILSPTFQAFVAVVLGTLLGVLVCIAVLLYFIKRSDRKMEP